MQLMQTSLQLWLRWFVASSAGLVLGFLISTGISTAEQVHYKLLSAALGGAAFGVCLASIQVLSISQYIKMRHWIVASLLGYSLGFVFMRLAIDLLQFDVWVAQQERSPLFFAIYSTLIGIVVGLPVGIMQWWNFRMGSVSLIGWILTDVLAIGVSAFTSALVAWMVNADQTLSGLEIPAILLPLAGIFSTISWLAVFRSRETYMPRNELPNVPTTKETNSINM